MQKKLTCYISSPGWGTKS